MELRIDLSRRILVTGATGFVGSHLMRHLLEKGYLCIRGIKRGGSRMDLVRDVLDQVEWVEGDILDVPFLEEVMEGVSVVFHCAAIVSFDPRDFKRMYEINGEGTANVVNMALESGVEHFIYVSSTAAIGRNERESHIDEDTKWETSKLNTHYAISKYLGDQEVWRGGAEGLKVAIVNPSVILGVQFWDHGTGRMFRQVWDGLRFYTSGVTGFVDVKDVVRFMVLLMEEGIGDERFVLSAENLGYKDVFDMIAKVLGKGAPSIQVTPLLSSLAWRVEWVRGLVTGLRPLITKETALTSGHSYYYSSAKALRWFPEFGFRGIGEVIGEVGVAFLATIN